MRATVSNSLSPVIARSSMRRAAPARAKASALSNWCWSAANGNGERMEGLPAAASSATAPAPDRHTTKSACGEGGRHVGDERQHFAIQTRLLKSRAPFVASGGSALMHDAHRQSGLAK
jgi:hypothetical protein